MTTNLNPLFFDKTQVDSFASLVKHFPDTEFCSPTRSNIPLLALICNGQEILGKLLETAGLPLDANMHLEFTVKPPTGRGKPSYTDLMVRSGSSVLAVEAKWTEQRYATVAQWLTDGSSVANRKNVLSAWLSLLQPHATRELNPTEFGGCVYQLLHRAASACWQSTHPQLAYLTFQNIFEDELERKQHYRQDLQHLYALLGSPIQFPFRHIQLGLNPTPAFGRLENLPKHKPSTSGKIREALQAEPLFEFSQFTHYQIATAQSPALP